MGQINDKKDIGGFFISAIAALVQANSSLLVIPEAKLLASIVGITTGFCAESDGSDEQLARSKDDRDKARMARSPINLDFTP